MPVAELRLDQTVDYLEVNDSALRQGKASMSGSPNGGGCGRHQRSALHAPKDRNCAPQKRAISVGCPQRPPSTRRSKKALSPGCGAPCAYWLPV